MAESTWRHYRRQGVVTARRHTEPWTWEAETGDTMAAEAGDWAVADSQGRSWSVKDPDFRESYEQLDEVRWRRTGTVSARPAETGEQLQTLEGPYTCRATDWVVTLGGAVWAVPSDHFAKVYQAADD